MSVSIFSFLTAILCFDMALLVCAGLRRRGGVLLRFGAWPLALVLAAGLARLLWPVTLAQTRVVHSTVLLPALQAALQWEVPLFSATVGACLPAVWLCGTAAGVLRLAWTLGRDGLWLRRRVSPGGQQRRLASIVRRVAGEKGAARCRFVWTNDILTPMMAGFFRPVFVLPVYLAGSGDREIELVLRHEWQHFRLGHNWWKLAAELVLCLLWWNPPVYLLRHETEQLMELSCDRRAVRGLTAEAKAAYLETIVRSLRRQKNAPAARGHMAHFLSGSSRAADVKQRFYLVAAIEKPTGRFGGALLCALFMAAALAASTLVVIQPFRVVPREAFGEDGIVTYEMAALGGRRLDEAGNGLYTEYLFDEPCYTYQGITYVTKADISLKHMIWDSGTLVDGGNRVMLHGECDYSFPPVYCRDEAGALLTPEQAGKTKASVSPPSPSDKDERIRYYRFSPRGFETRLWSATQCRWLTEWEDADC